MEGVNTQLATIKINPGFFSKASQEFLGMAVLHEMLHIILRGYKAVENEWKDHSTMYFKGRLLWLIYTGEGLFPPSSSTANVDESDIISMALDGFTDAWLQSDPNDPIQIFKPNTDTYSQTHYGLPLSVVKEKINKLNNGPNLNGNTKGTNFCH